LAGGGKRDPESCGYQCEHALFAGGMAPEFDPTAHERSVERQGRLTVVPALNEEGFLPQARPIENLLRRERMVARNRCEDPLAVERRCHSIRPERMACHQ